MNRLIAFQSGISGLDKEAFRSEQLSKLLGAASPKTKKLILKYLGNMSDFSGYSAAGRMNLLKKFGYEAKDLGSVAASHGMSSSRQIGADNWGKVRKLLKELKPSVNSGTVPWEGVKTPTREGVRRFQAPSFLYDV